MTEEPGHGARNKGQGYTLRPLRLSSAAVAQQELERIGVDPAGIVRMLPKLEHHALLVKSLRPAAANIIKQEMLSLGGDAAVARGTVACTVASTDLLLIGTGKQLSTLCTKLQGQPFGLQQLSRELAALLQTISRMPEYWQTSRRRLMLDRPLIMGILNVTPDSFSDGGRHNDVSRAVEHALKMIAEGADLIDVGGESTRPGAAQVTEAEERRRVLPVIEALADHISVPISIDTWKAAVADAALSAGAEIVNDISGLTFDPAMATTVAGYKAGLVLMHTRGRPQQMQQDTGYTDLMGEVTDMLRHSLDEALTGGISSEQIVVDPGIGIGFGKDTAGNLELLHRLPELKGLGRPLLVGTSRKTFIGKTLQRDAADDRLFGTAATVALAVAGGAQILRVHDVQAMKDVALMAHAVVNPPT